MRDIHHVRKHLTLDASTALANALVSSRLDYYNSLLHFLLGVHLIKLQRVQNALARGKYTNLYLSSQRFSSQV